MAGQTGGGTEGDETVTENNAFVVAHWGAYRPVFDTHEWGDVAEHLSHLSKQKRWNEMEPLVTDEMVEAVAVVAPHERLAAAVVERYGGICTKVEFSIPVASPDDANLLASMVRTIQDESNT